MSIPAEAVVEPQAPIEDVALATGKSGDEAQQLLSKRDARRGVHEDRRAAKEAQPAVVDGAVAEDAAGDPDAKAVSETAEEKATRVAGEEQARINAAGRKIDPKTGQFLPNDVVADVAAAGGGDFKPIAIPIPKGHPLLEMGQPEIMATSPEQEQVIRAALNGIYFRRQEVEAKDTMLAERDKTILSLREQIVRRDASAAAQAKFPESPAYQAHVETYNEIRDTVSQAAASAYWQSPAVQNDLRPIEDGEFMSRWEEVQAQADQEAGEAWANEALHTATTTLPPEMVALPNFTKLFDACVASFDAEVGSGVHGDPSTLTAADLHTKFGEVLRHYLLRDNGMRAVLDAKLKARDSALSAKQQEENRKKAEAEAAVKAAAAKAAVEEFKRSAADTRRATPPHPLGALTDAARGVHASGTASLEPGDGPDYDSMNPRQLRKELKRGARLEARARHTPT
ncbi:MAG: hypothetical protein NUW01_18350 [Gemmatimonadaceae bacterium]|nr:hypothetical protein [Gemmatimonadaceae bacterium]